MSWSPLPSLSEVIIGERVKIVQGARTGKFGIVACTRDKNSIGIKLDHTQGTIAIPGSYSTSIEPLHHCLFLRTLKVKE